MKRIVLFGLVLLALLPVAAGAARKPAGVRVATMKPFVVTGTHFKRGEMVRVITQLHGKHVRTVKASRTGAFSARFLRLKATFCSGYYVRAMGSKGSIASARRISDCAGG
jgi:hypothetical protein